MNIDLITQPLPGTDLLFTVSGGSGATDIRVFIDADLVYQHECDDPPCHEMLKIPAYRSGSLLRVTATDDAGNSEDLVVTLPDGSPGSPVPIYEEH